MSGFQHGASAASAAAEPPPPIVTEEYTLVAGENGPAPNEHTGFSDGTVGPAQGSLSPNVDYEPNGNNYDISMLETVNTNLTFRLKPQNIPNIDQSFVNISITGTFEQGTFTRVTLRSEVNAYQAISGGTTQWAFTTIPSLDMINGNSYDIIIEWTPV
jgi:hypothetical protein